VIRLKCCSCGVVPAERRRICRRIGAHRDPFVVIIEDRGKGIGPLALIVPFHQQTAVAISDRVPESSHICCHHGATTGLRLERDETEGFVVGRDCYDVRDAIPADRWPAVQVSLTTLRPSRSDRR